MDLATAIHLPDYVLATGSITHAQAMHPLKECNMTDVGIHTHFASARCYKAIGIALCMHVTYLRRGLRSTRPPCPPCPP